jgi:hypothetical protein
MCEFLFLSQGIKLRFVLQLNCLPLENNFNVVPMQMVCLMYSSFLTKYQRPLEAEWSCGKTSENAEMLEDVKQQSLLCRAEDLVSTYGGLSADPPDLI